MPKERSPIKIVYWIDGVGGKLPLAGGDSLEIDAAIVVRLSYRVGYFGYGIGVQSSPFT
jgi:hypothetical protein